MIVFVRVISLPKQESLVGLKIKNLKVSRDQSFTAIKVRKQEIRFWYNRILKFNPYFWLTISVG